MTTDDKLKKAAALNEKSLKSLTNGKIDTLIGESLGCNFKTIFPFFSS